MSKRRAREGRGRFLRHESDLSGRQNVVFVTGHKLRHVRSQNICRIMHIEIWIMVQCVRAGRSDQPCVISPTILRSSDDPHAIPPSSAVATSGANLARCTSLFAVQSNDLFVAHACRYLQAHRKQAPPLDYPAQDVSRPGARRRDCDKLLMQKSTDSAR